jgi:hypothetical protein
MRPVGRRPWQTDKKTLTMFEDGPGPDGKPTHYKMITELHNQDRIGYTTATTDKEE